MKEYWKVPHKNLPSGIKAREIGDRELTNLMEGYVNWKYEDSFFTDKNGEYFKNEELNIDKQYVGEDDEDLVNELYEKLYDFYTSKLEADKSLDIGDYDIEVR